MGCATSSPFIAANGAVMDAAKEAASEAVHAGEEAINEVKDSITGTVSHVKEAMVGAAHNVGQSLDNVLTGKKSEVIENINNVTDNMKNNLTNNKIMDENIVNTTLNEISDKINNKTMEYNQEIDKMADDFIKETEDLVEDSKERKNDDTTKTIKKFDHTNSVHSIDSLRTNSPDPEIEKAFANDKIMNPPTPKPTLAELERLDMEAKGLKNQNINENSEESLIESKLNQLNESTSENSVQTVIDNETTNITTTEQVLKTSPTSWEKLADVIEKLPPHKVKLYQQIDFLTSAEKQLTVDNILKEFGIKNIKE